MTENKLNITDIFILMAVTLLTILAIIYGFSAIPSPAQERISKLDHKRVTDLGAIQQSIEEYATTNSYLPNSLDDIKPTAYSGVTALSKNDPETKQPYEYSKIDDSNYQLCATFTTDSTKEPNSLDTENFTYPTYKATFEHGTGHKCFPFTHTFYNNNYNSPSPTEMPFGTPSPSPFVIQ